VDIHGFVHQVIFEAAIPLVGETASEIQSVQVPGHL